MHLSKIQKGQLFGLSLLSLLAYGWIGYFLERSNFTELLFCFTISFAAFFLFVSKIKLEKLSIYLALGILFRLIFLFSTPSLSDDYFRFIWDGQLLANGLNPFDLKPSEIGINIPNKTELLSGMNSPNYYTVYPPIAQLLYFISAKLSPNSIFGSIVVMRSILLLAEIGIIFLLPKLLQNLNLDPKKALWYILNPLVIVELTGNLHFEGIVIFFFLLATYLLFLNKHILSSVAWALAAATKLIPVLLLPILLRKLKLKQAIVFYISFALIFTLIWLPFYSPNMLSHLIQSIRLYSEAFEFNASVYYFVREIGFAVKGYNIIQSAGPWLTIMAYLGILILLLKRKVLDWNGFFTALLFALSWYYCMALIVHPWYITFLVFLGVFTRFNYPFLWSFMAILSYSSYSNPYFHENYWWIAVEYIGVTSFLVYELTKQQAVKNLHK